MLVVKGTKVRFKRDHDGNQVSSDGGETWQFTFRGEREFREMWRNHTITTSEDHVRYETDEDERDAELEIFGETLDEPIPEDLADMLFG